jgi:hypothetical protein
MWDLKQHALRGDAFREITLVGVLVTVAIAVTATIASFWCNTVFAYAVASPRPRIAPAVRQTRACMPRIIRAGVILGLVTAAAAVWVPRIDSALLYVVVVGALYAAMLIGFVAVPARILGATRHKAPPTEVVGRWVAGGALSAAAMTPGFILDRIGLILLGVPGLHVIGLALLSIGTALYAAGMSSVKAVKLTMKLDLPT